VYLRGGWHLGRVSVVADWVEPTENGFYACALAEVGGPGAESFVTRQESLVGALQDGDAAPLAIACVERGTGDVLRYVDCARPHDGEFVGAYTITPLDAPFNADAVRSAATKGCTDVALSYLGLPATGTRDDLSAASVGPKTASDWLGSDQTFACYVLAKDGKVRGSVRGLGSASLPR
jgi:hypothetical protein